MIKNKTDNKVDSIKKDESALQTKTIKQKSDLKITQVAKNKKGVVLFVGPIPGVVEKWIAEVQPRYALYNLQSKKQTKEKIAKAQRFCDKVIQCAFSNDDSIAQALAPFRDDIIAITSRSEAKMWYFKRTIPHVPYVLTPTEKSLLWSTDKIEMRKRMSFFDKEIAPKFVVVKDASVKTIETIEKQVGYPLLVKPSGLSSSMLVTNCYHRDELEKALASVFKQANIFHRLYKEFYKEDTPQVLVEELMEGDMYSVDGVVNSKGKCFVYPSVHIKTGKQIGFDDYFGYQQMTPTLLKQKSFDTLEKVAIKGVHSLGLRNTHFHAEFIRSEEGWKIIEIAPRIGGFRQDLYKYSYGIDCTANDIRIRMGLEPKIPKSKKGYTAALKIFAKTEGVIKSIRGLKKVKELTSVLSVDQAKTHGDKALFAKNG